MTAPSFNPFPGLRPFEDADAKFFFGRDEQVDQLLKRLQRDQRFVGVVGQSGCGKSSLVRAGLLPVLYAGFMARAGSSWRVAVMRPSDAGGDKPIESLAQALERSGTLENVAEEKPLRIGQTIATLLGGARGLVEVVQQARLAADENILIVVDQFEELFRFRHSLGAAYVSDDAAAFVKLLLEASRYRDADTGAPLPVYVLITMRSDFIGDCAQFRTLPETLNDGLFLVPRLTRDQMQEAIEGPVGVARASIAPRLVNRLLNEPTLGDNPDELPVLQHALMRMWDIWASKKTDRPLDIEDYEATGGLAKALSLHGDEILASLGSDRLRSIAERAFKALTMRGSDNRGVRRPTKVADLVAVTDASIDDVRRTIDPFRARDVSFLMPPEQRPLEETTVVDLTHEALMRNWIVLAQWVDEEAESAREYERVRDAEEEHAKGNEGLLVDPRLSIAELWRERNHPTPAWAERYGGGYERVAQFLDASRAAVQAELLRQQQAEQRERENERRRIEAEEAAKRERLEREAEVARVQAASAQSAARRTRGWLVATSLIMALAVVMAVLAFQKQRIAVSEAREATIARNDAVQAQRKAESSDRLAHAALRGETREAIAAHNEAVAEHNEALAEARAAHAAQVAEVQAQQETQKAIAAGKTVAQDLVHERNEAGSLQLAALDHALYEAGYDNRAAGLVGVDAYRLAPTGLSKSLLLPAAYTVGALGRVALPPWNLGTVTRTGRDVVVLAGTRQQSYGQEISGSLVSVDASSLGVLGHLANVRASLMCGFETRPRVAVAANGRIDSYDVEQDGSFLRGPSLHTGVVRALGCAPNGDVVYVDGAGVVRAAALGSADPSTIARAGGDAFGLTLSPSGRYVAVTSSSGHVKIYSTRTGQTEMDANLFADPFQDCSLTAGCARALAFVPGERQIAWYSSGQVNIASLPGSATAPNVQTRIPCSAQSCKHAALTYMALGSYPIVIGGTHGVSRYNQTSKRYTESYDDEAGSQRSPILDDDFLMYLTPYDPAEARQPNPLGSGLSAQSLSNLPGPLMGTAPNTQWAWANDYGLSEHYVLMPRNPQHGGGFYRFDLDHFRQGFNQPRYVSYQLQMRDSADRTHAVTFDWQTGIVQVLDIRSWPVRVLHQFNVPPVVVDKKTDSYTRTLQIGYDPQSDVVTMLAYNPTRGVVLSLNRYDAARCPRTGTCAPAFVLSGSKLVANAGLQPSDVELSAWREPHNVFLSARGNYVLLRAKHASDVIMRSDGARVAGAYEIEAISPNEGYVLAEERRGQGMLTMYRLPQWTRVALVGIPANTPPVAISADGRTIAYYWYSSGNKRSYLELYDVASWVTYDYALPDPPDLDNYTGLTFNADATYLLAAYDDDDNPVQADHKLGVYSTDPKAWMRSACLMAGRPLSAQEFRWIAGGSMPYSNGCAPFARKMYRWPR